MAPLRATSRDGLTVLRRAFNRARLAKKNAPENRGVLHAAVQQAD
jgi:hypothetical protein